MGEGVVPAQSTIRNAVVFHHAEDGVLQLKRVSIPGNKISRTALEVLAILTAPYLGVVLRAAVRRVDLQGSDNVSDRL